MSLPPMDGVSSSTPRRSRPKLRTSRSLPPPPPEEIEMYWKRPLPPLPQRRNSVLLAFRKEVDEALATPEPVVRLENGTIQLIFSGKTLPDGAQAEISSQTDTCLDKTRCRKGLKINTGFIRAEESHSPTFTHLHSELQLDGEVSPLSDDTGDYSPRGPSTAVSSVDDDVEDDGLTFSPGAARDSLGSGFPDRRGIRLSAIPSPLRISKPPGLNRKPEREFPETSTDRKRFYLHDPSPRIENEQGNAWRDTPSVKFTLDVSPETVTQLSQGACWDSSNTGQSGNTERLGPASLPTTFRDSHDTANASKFCDRLPPLQQQQQQKILPFPSQSPSASCTRFSWNSDVFPHGTMSSSGTAGPVSISTDSGHMNGDARSSMSTRHHKANQAHFVEYLSPGPETLNTKTPMSALATKTADLVDSAASIMDGTLNGRKRRKWRLKSNFLGSEDGVQSFAPKSS